jgi:membrane protease YdiL (CAAX protease family)
MENTMVLALDGRECGKECKKTVSRLHFSITVYLLVSSAVALIILFGIGILGVIDPRIVETIMTTPLYYNIYIWGTQILSMYLISFPVFYTMTKHLPRRDLAGGEKLGLFNFLGLAIASMGIMTIGSIVAGTISDTINEHFGIVIENTTADLVNQSDIWSVILVVVIIGPIFEELIFRKIFVDTIGKYSIGLAVFISGASFALFHGNLTQVIYTFAVGLILAWVYAKTKKMIYPILLHMFLNFFGTVPSLLVMDSIDRVLGMTDEEIMNATDPQILADIAKVNAVSFMNIGFMVLGSLILLGFIFGGFFKLDKSGEVKIPFFKKLGVLIFNWGTIVFVAYSLLTILSNIFLPLFEQYLEQFLA